MDRNQQAEQVRVVIEMLERVQQRPSMYLGSLRPYNQGLAHFLVGFRCACHACGLSFDVSLYIEVAALRGWSFKSEWPDVRLMKQQAKLSDAAIQDEVLTIEVAVWRRLQERLATAER